MGSLLLLALVAKGFPAGAVSVVCALAVLLVIVPHKLGEVMRRIQQPRLAAA